MNRQEPTQGLSAIAAFITRFEEWDQRADKIATNRPTIPSDVRYWLSSADAARLRQMAEQLAQAMSRPASRIAIALQAIKDIYIHGDTPGTASPPPSTGQAAGEYGFPASYQVGLPIEPGKPSEWGPRIYPDTIGDEPAITLTQKRLGELLQQARLQGMRDMQAIQAGAPAATPMMPDGKPDG